MDLIFRMLAHSNRSMYFFYLCVGLTVFSVLVYLALLFSIPQFIELFKGFGMDLPAATMFVLDTYRYFGFISLLGVIPCGVLVWKRQTIDKTSFWIKLIILNFFFSLLVLSFAIYSLYLPSTAKFHEVVSLT